MKELLNITIDSRPHMYCDEIIIASISNHWKTDFELMFLHNWRFEYNIRSKDITNSIQIPVDFNQKMILLHKYHGIEFQKHCNTSFDILNKTKEELQKGNIAAVFLNSKLCSWLSESDRRNEAYFPYLILKYQSNNIYVLDIHYSKQVKSISDKVFVQCVLSEWYLYIRHNSDSNVRLIKEDIIHNILENKAISMENFRKFAEHAKMDLHLEKEFWNSANLEDTELYYKITECFRSRRLFIETLNYLNKKIFFNIGDFIVRYQVLPDQWKLLWSMIYKIHLKKDIYLKKDRIVDIIWSIAEMELNLYEEFEDLTVHNKIKNNANINTLKSNTLFFENYTVIDINHYFNNQSFATDLVQTKADILNQTAEDYHMCFLSEDLESDKLCADNIVYSICRHNDERKDNLVCLGQSIPVSVRQYRGIALLATSWGGSFTEDILLQFTDGTEEIISFGISDFYSDVPMFGETIACCLRTAAGFHGGMVLRENYIGNIFSTLIPMNTQNKLLFNIKLPDFQNIHIFSLVMLV